MKSTIAIWAAALLAVAFTSAADIRAARAQTSEAPPQNREQAEPKKPDDKPKEHGAEHGGRHDGDCCKMMHEMHEMHGKMHDMKPMHEMQGHDSKDGGEHGCCRMMNGH